MIYSPSLLHAYSSDSSVMTSSSIFLVAECLFGFLNKKGTVYFTIQIQEDWYCVQKYIGSQWKQPTPNSAVFSETKCLVWLDWVQSHNILGWFHLQVRISANMRRRAGGRVWSCLPLQLQLSDWPSVRTFANVSKNWKLLSPHQLSNSKTQNLSSGFRLLLSGDAMVAPLADRLGIP